MGIKITGRKSLSDFDKRLNKMKAGDLANRIATRLAEWGVETAKNEYNFSRVQNVSIYYENNGDGTAKIIAEGEGLAYIEFGTGIMGKFSYPDDDKLPKETRIFHSRGDWQSTEGWQYNYYKEQNKNTNPDLPNWDGFEAGAQMFKTAQTLKDYFIISSVRNAIKGEGKR